MEVQVDVDRALRAATDFANWLGAERDMRTYWSRQHNPYGYFDVPEWRDLDRQINERTPLVASIAERVDGPDLAGRLRSEGDRRQAAQELVGVLSSLEEKEAILAPQGPKLRAQQLHPWVWAHAANLWANGHRREAVTTTCTALFDSHIPAKLGRPRDVRGGKDLLGQAFSTKDPEPNSPRLRLPGYEPGTTDWTSAHEGAMHFGQGCAQSIRNLQTHDLEEPDEDIALEMLAALSYLARLVDSAQVVRAPAVPEVVQRLLAE